MTSHQMVSLSVVVYFLMTVSWASSSGSSVWGQWGTWSQCSATCGDGIRSRRRTCSPTQGACAGETTETNTCNITACCVPQNGRWSDWGSWSSCSVSCGRGTRTGSRTCYGANACGRPCVGNNSTKVYCNDNVCPAWGAWSSWTCSDTCETRTMSRTRTCTPPSATCSGDASDTQWCQRLACCVPRHGQWNNWGRWSSCSVSCGQGTRTRSRTCYGPSACGRPCEGNNSTEEPCNDNVCPGSPDMASLTIFNDSNYAHLRCLVAKEYAQEFELFKVTSNGTRITRNLTSSTNYVNFKLENIQCQDAGIYYCRARKGLKTANSTSVQLNIPCSPRRPPGTSTTPERIEVMEGSKGQYTFAVIAHPVPTIEDISYHTEDPVSSLKKKPVRSDFITGVCQQNTPDLHLATCSLSITGALPTDDGLYSLKVSNSRGIVNVIFQLSVIAQDTTQSNPSLFWIGLVIVPILILIGALVVLVIRRRAAQTKISEDKEISSTGHRMLSNIRQEPENRVLLRTSGSILNPRQSLNPKRLGSASWKSVMAGRVSLKTTVQSSMVEITELRRGNRRPDPTRHTTRHTTRQSTRKVSSSRNSTFPSTALSH